MEASTLTSASRFALIARRSPLLRLQGDERLIALTREGNDRAFEALVERYQPRLHAFCRGMLGSTEDAEDVLQEVFVAAHAAIRADNRPINARPWLFRIARNRCLNHLRRPVPEGQDSMDVHPANSGASVDDRVQSREDFRALLADVRELPETQRTALLLREVEALSYEEIAQAMETTVPAVKSLLVRARMQLAECSQARQLTCDEVRLELAEAAEGLRKVSGPVRAHLRRCEPCREYRAQLRNSSRQLAALSPIGPLAALYQVVFGKLGLGGSAGAGAGAGTAGAGAGAAGAGASVGGAVATGMAASGAAGALGTKAAAGVASVALITAGAVEVNRIYTGGGEQATPAAKVVAPPPSIRYGLEQPLQARTAKRREAGARKRRVRDGASAALAAEEVQPGPVAPAVAVPEPTSAAGTPAETNAAGAHQGDDGTGVSAAPEAGSGIATPPAGGSAGGPAPAEPSNPPVPAEPPTDAEPPPAEVEPEPQPEPDPGETAPPGELPG